MERIESVHEKLRQNEILLNIALIATLLMGAAVAGLLIGLPLAVFMDKVVKPVVFPANYSNLTNSSRVDYHPLPNCASVTAEVKLGLGKPRPCLGLDTA